MSRWAQPRRLTAGAILMVSAALAVVYVDSSSAASRGAQPVEGGGGFADAPPLRAGTYSGTILPRETLFYAIRLRAGQRLRVDATIDLRPGSRTRGIADTLGAFSLRLYSPLRQRLAVGDAVGLTDRRDLLTDFASIRGPEVVSFTRAARAAPQGADWSGPGLYHLTASVSGIRNDVGAIVELPIRLRIKIDEAAGAPAGRTAAGPLEAPLQPVAVASAPDKPVVVTADRRHWPTETLAAAAAALVLGVVIAFGAAAVLGRGSMNGV